MYGVLMLLPQSSAFAALKNRLNSVSAIGYLHIAPRAASSTSTSAASSTPSGSSSSATRSLKARESEVKWTELLDTFRATQDRAARVGVVGAPRAPLRHRLAIVGGCAHDRGFRRRRGNAARLPQATGGQSGQPVTVADDGEPAGLGGASAPERLGGREELVEIAHP